MPLHVFPGILEEDQKNKKFKVTLGYMASLD